MVAGMLAPNNKALIASAAALGALHKALGHFDKAAAAAIETVKAGIDQNVKLSESAQTLIGAQQRLNSAINSGDTDQIAKSMESLKDQIYAFPDELPGGDKLRAQLVGAGGDVKKMTEVLGEFQKEAQRLAAIGEIKIKIAVAQNIDREGMGPFGLGPKQISESIPLIGGMGSLPFISKVGNLFQYLFLSSTWLSIKSPSLSISFAEAGTNFLKTFVIALSNHL